MEQPVIPFHKPYRLETALPLVEQVLLSGRTEGDGPMTARCQEILSEQLASDFNRRDLGSQDDNNSNSLGTPEKSTLLVTSGTHALELAVQALQLNPGDEVIVPSFAYPSAANAVLLAGGTVVYSEVESIHLNLDPDRLSCHITERTRAIILVHYGGISCDMAPIMEIAKQKNLCIIEDCAQSFLTTYHGQLTGTFGTFGCFSFHGTKDVVSGEGGALQINDPVYVEKARQFRQKGTNRDAFASGKVSFYDWQATGSSYAPGELPMALLAAQLELAPEILTRKRTLFSRYASHFTQKIHSPDYQAVLSSTSTSHADKDVAIEPFHSQENGHLFYLIFKKVAPAHAFIRHLASKGIEARTHFVPLHESRFGRSFIRPENGFHIETGLGQRLVRLPLFAAMTESDQMRVLEAADTFFTGGCQ